MLAASAVAGLAVGASATAKAASRATGPDLPPEPSEDQDLAPAEVLEVLPEGTKLGAWTVVHVHAPRMGALPVTLDVEGHRFQVDVMRRADAGPRGVAETETLSIFLSNEGDGETDTDELEGRGAIVLAHFLASRPCERLPKLASHGERARAFPGGRYHVPR
jgi:hypothetical protein